MEYYGCISSTKPSKYFTKDFLDSSLFKLIKYDKKNVMC